MIKTVGTTKNSRRAFKRYHHVPVVVAVLGSCLRLLKSGEKLPKKFQNHRLKGNKKNFYECHLQSDLLLVYCLSKTELKLVDIGSHSEIFG